MKNIFSKYLLRSTETYLISYDELEHRYIVGVIHITRYILGFVTAEVYYQGKLVHKGWSLWNNDLQAVAGAKVDGIAIYDCWVDASEEWFKMGHSDDVAAYYGIMLYEGNVFYTPGFKRMQDMGYSFHRI